MSFCQYRTNEPIKSGNCYENSELNQNRSNLNEQHVSYEQENNDCELKENCEKNCNNCSNEVNNENMCDHSKENEGCKFHFQHRRNSQSNFRDGFTNIRCKFCWYINRIHNGEIKEAQNSFQTYIKCVYCLSNISIKNLKPNTGISHPYCGKCQMTAHGSHEPFTHTDCKYCQNGFINKRSQKSRTTFPHTDCKYCHNANCESTDSSFEECEETCSLPNQRYIPCSLHDVPYQYPRHYAQNGRLFPSKYHSFMHQRHGFEDSCDIDYIRETLRGVNLSSTFQPNESMDNHNMERLRFRPCENCLKNGESEVIYNSHQYQNPSGVVTCPLVRQYAPTQDFHYCPHKNEDFITMHPYANGYTQHTSLLPDFPHSYSRKVNGTRGFRYSF